jgi:hypothetical protein
MIVPEYTKEAVFDINEQQRIQERLDALGAKYSRVVVKSRLSQSDVRYKCTCCTFPKRVIITLDASGNERYTCPETRITMTLMQCRPMPYTAADGSTQFRDASTYAAGHLHIGVKR